MAATLQITARDLEAFGMIDDVISEPAMGATTDPDTAASLVEQAIVAQLDELRRYDVRHLVSHRYERIRHLGDEYVQAPSRRKRVARWLRRRVSLNGHEQTPASATP